MSVGYNITLRTASRFYSFLTKDEWVRNDIDQVAHLVDLCTETQKEAVSWANKELYRLARDLGWRKVNVPGSWSKKTWRKTELQGGLML